MANLLQAAHQVAPSGSSKDAGLVTDEQAEALPPPRPLAREQAEALIGLSPVKDCGLERRLARSFRMSPLPLKTAADLERGASRLAAPPDVPPGFAWPEYMGTPLTLLAQVRLEDVAALDDDKPLPKTGWLCFFYACQSGPPPTGLNPAHAGAARVTYFDEPVEELQRVSPPGAAKKIFVPHGARFWREWTLPSLNEEPNLVPDVRKHRYYDDLCSILAGHRSEPPWHHLLGEAQNCGKEMRPVCELVSKGVVVTDDMDLSDPKWKPKLAKAREWVLLLQIDLGYLSRLDESVDPAQLPRGSSVELRFADRLYYWIRAQDLQAQDFSRAWAIVQCWD